jgi:hypothetical protein
MSQINRIAYFMTEALTDAFETAEMPEMHALLMQRLRFTINKLPKNMHQPLDFD